MDLLGSILGSMEAPPSMDANEKKKAREQREKMEKMQKQEKAKKELFQEKIQKHIETFIKKPDKKKIQFPPMDKVKRTIVHEVADIAGLASFSFGPEDERYVAIWKKEFAPCDDELNALKRGEVYDPELKSKEEQRKAELEKELEASRRESEKLIPSSSYRDKYEHILNRKVDHGVKRQFGMVPTANKSDTRTIEEIMADSRKKKSRLDDKADAS